jgi:hypothetical protein
VGTRLAVLASNLALDFWAANVKRWATAVTKKGGTSLLNREAHAA